MRGFSDVFHENRFLEKSFRIKYIKAYKIDTGEIYLFYAKLTLGIPYRLTRPLCITSRYLKLQGIRVRNKVFSSIIPIPQIAEWGFTMPGRSTAFMVASGGVLSERYRHGGPGVCLGDDQTEAEGVYSRKVDAATRCSGVCPHN